MVVGVQLSVISYLWLVANSLRLIFYFLLLKHYFLVTRNCSQGEVTCNYFQLYTNLLVNRRGKLYKAVLLLFCCRSESALILHQPDSWFYYAVRCSICTLLLSFLFRITRNINNKKKVFIPKNNNEKENIFTDGNLLIRASLCPNRDQH